MPEIWPSAQDEQKLHYGVMESQVALTPQKSAIAERDPSHSEEVPGTLPPLKGLHPGPAPLHPDGSQPTPLL